ncbi:MAG: response regulator [Elusimicrobia bacterium]|nr:response regulator [Elusimicrobiota bacterium]
METVSQDFDLNELVEQAIQRCARDAAVRSIELLHFIPSDVPLFLRGRQAELSEALALSLQLTVKTARAGAVVIRVNRESQSGSAISLRFSIGEAEPGSIAGQEETRRRSPELSRIEQLARSMKGTAGLGPSPAGPSCLWLSLPLERQKPLPSAPWQKKIFPRTRALIFDDSPAHRAAMRQRLAQWNIEADAARDEAEASACLQNARAAGHKYDLVLIDLDIPKRQGWVVVEKVMKDVQFSGLGLILMSSTLPNARQTRGSHKTTFLSKPIRQQDLFEALGDILGAVAADAPPPAEPEDIPEAFPKIKLEPAIQAPVEAPVPLETANPAAIEPTLPPAPAGEKEAGDTQPIEPPVPLKKHFRVLLASSDPGIHALRGALLDRGYESDLVAGKTGLIASLKEHFYGMILLDMSFHPDPPKLIKEFKGEGEKLWIPVVILKEPSQAAAESWPVAGFADKPLMMPALEALLSRWDTPILTDRLDKIRNLGGQKLVHEMIGIFLEEWPRRHAFLKKAMEIKDAAAAEQAAHSLKSGASNVGIVAVQALCYRIEKLARDGAIDQASELLHPLYLQCRLAQEALQPFYKADYELPSELKLLSIPAEPPPLAPKPAPTPKPGPKSAAQTSIPQAEKAMPELKPASAPKIRRSQPGKAVLCDDDRTLTHILEHILLSLGFTVTVCDNGQDGLNSIRNERPQLVILDLNMPTKDGLEVLKDLQESPLQGSSPYIIVLSNHESREIKAKVSGLGATEMMHKPFHPTDFRQKISRLLQEETL